MDLLEADIAAQLLALRQVQALEGSDGWKKPLAVVLATTGRAQFTAGGTGDPVSGCAIHATESAG